MIFVPYYFRNFSFQIFLIDFVQKQFSYIGAKNRKNQHCGFQKKKQSSKKSSSGWRWILRDAKNKRKWRFNLMNVKQTNKQTKQTPVNADCIFSTTMYYLQWFKAAVCEYSSFWWDLYVITVCSWDSIAVIRCSQCE